MARKSTPKSATGKDATDTVAADAGELGGDTVLVGDDALGEDTVAAERDPGSAVTIEPGDTTSAENVEDELDPSQTEIVDDMAASQSGDAKSVGSKTDPSEPVAADTIPTETLKEPVAEEKTPRPTPAPAPAARGPGVVPLVIGGAVAAGLGYAAAFFGMAAPEEVELQTDPALTQAISTLETQQATIADLEAQIAQLASVEPPVIPEVDLSAVETGISDVATQLDSLATNVDTLASRVGVLEDRPVFTGEASADNEAMAAAVDALEQRLNAERDAAAQAAAEAQAAREEAAAAQAAATAELQAAAEAAQAAIAEAEARARATADATQSQAALSRIQIAMASGAPFEDALADLPVEAPEALAAAAANGVPTLDELRASFPAAARAALPIALRESSGDSAAERASAFLLGQIGGRSVEPQDGPGPDAVLSRAEAAVAAGDLETALAEISALPEGAQTAMADWVGTAQSRLAADAAMAELAATLDN